MPYKEKNWKTLAAALADREITDPMADALAMLRNVCFLWQLRQMGRDFVGKRIYQISASVDILQTIPTLPNLRVETHYIARCLAGSKAAYGWMAKTQPGSLVNKYDMVMLQCSGDPIAGGLQ